MNQKPTETKQEYRRALELALQFYANHENWMDNHPFGSLVSQDKGNVALDALDWKLRNKTDGKPAHLQTQNDALRGQLDKIGESLGFVAAHGIDKYEGMSMFVAVQLNYERKLHLEERDQLRTENSELKRQVGEASNSVIEWMAKTEAKSTDIERLKGELAIKNSTITQCKYILGYSSDDLVSNVEHYKAWTEGEIDLLKANNVEAIREHERMVTDNAKLRPLAQELSEAWSEAACCDDIPLDRPLSKFIANLRTHRDRLRDELAEAQQWLDAEPDWKNKFMTEWDKTSKERDSLKAQLAEIEKEHDEEIGEFQNDAKALIDELTGANVDGAGCDSGDWRDLTLTEIRQGIGHVKAQLANAGRDCGWQPISTAPHDRHVDLWTGTRRVADCYRDPIDNGFRTLLANGQLFCVRGETHWREIPPAITATKEGR